MLINRLIWKFLAKLFTPRTLVLMRFDILRYRTRKKYRRKKDLSASSPKLHFGCGDVKIKGWLNVDLFNSDFNIDLGKEKLPWKSEFFDVLAGQHVIEHLDLHTECVPTLRECHRILKVGGELWLSCPDIEKICRFYFDGNLAELIQLLKKHTPGYGVTPQSHVMNHLFHQGGYHRNLFDLNLMKWLLEETGFRNIRRKNEQDLITRFPEFPLRNDDFHSLYVCAQK